MEKITLRDGEVREGEKIHYLDLCDGVHNNTEAILLGEVNADSEDQLINGDDSFTPSFKHLKSLLDYCKENKIKHNIKLRPKGYLESHNRKVCAVCKFYRFDEEEDVPECTKLEIPFYISLEDICDEFKEK